ncbi:hypothetical protein EVAR_61773_1 [Eumeta japonica]|uniref:Uncharacterized protein n=1 Tax=Eumeta variegata TaxID=151549 RepID=A0A4C1Z421_EUMVA|nr:hypothetical protein EVAR_61773_1 [Eumeta japonica]
MGGQVKPLTFCIKIPRAGRAPIPRRVQIKNLDKRNTAISYKYIFVRFKSAYDFVELNDKKIKNDSKEMYRINHTFISRSGPNKSSRGAERPPRAQHRRGRRPPQDLIDGPINFPNEANMCTPT